MFGSGYLVPSTDNNSDLAKRAMALDSAQHMLEIFGGILPTSVNLEIPDAECDANTACT
jgi:hypothetical protein